MKRRKFLQVAGVTTAGLAAGCGSGEPDTWMPYVTPPEDLVPGIPTVYASTCRECPAGCGILVKAREGRPVKIEGNPQHPVNRGRLCARGQAALQGLYDPDRITQPMKKDGGRWTPVSWDEAEQMLATALTAASAAGADRIAFIGAADSGPLDAFYGSWLQAFRSARRVRYEAFAFEPLREANRLCFGAATVAHYDFAAARYVLSFGADFLETWLSPTEYTAGFASAHGFHEGRMARFVAVEPRRGLTGYSADEWVAPKPGTEHLVALGIANAIFRIGRARVTGGDADALRGFLSRFDGPSVAEATGVPEAVLERLAREFTDAQPSLAVAGGVAVQHRAATQTAVAANILNVVAGNMGRTVSLPAASMWDGVARYQDMKALAAAMDGGAVDVVLVHGGANPAFTMPAGAAFAAALGKVGLKVSFASHLDETAELCDLLLPDHTPLEQWGAVVPMAGVTSMLQPAVRPVHRTKQTADVLIAVAQKAGKPAGAAASAQGLATAGVANLNTVLQRGGTFGTPVARPVRLVRDFARLDYRPAAFDGAADGLALLATPSPMLYDGRGANKAWLQEVPDPATKVTWQTWVEVHPETASRLGVRNGDVVTVSAGERTATAVVYVYPGVRPDTVAMPIGRGHTAYGRYAANGANPLALLGDVADPSGALAYAQVKVTLAKTADRRPLATTEGSARQHDRGIARIATLAAVTEGHLPHAHEPFTETERDAIAAAAAAQQAARTKGAYAAEGLAKWEMAIDLSRCTGCSACVTACYAENNLPVVGESQVVRSREMSWIRLERYFEGDTAGTDWHVAQVPMLCQHCANAPCEPVCPVYAAYHTPDGLNGQIYNRCVGTRYCANNCPYKVRYFNFWDYGAPDSAHFAWPGTLRLGLNPDVTVRTKGVMEKCTFCVQRIRHAQNDARVRNGPVTDAAVQPACAETCPAGAITFGNANDPSSAINRVKRDARGYHVFEMLNTKPGVTYLTRVIHAEAAATAAGEAH